MVLRLLAHFPARQTTKDAIISSDLGGDLVAFKIGVGAFMAVCDDLRREATAENPWVPPSGEILNRAKRENERLQKHLTRLTDEQVKQLSAPARENKPKSPWEIELAQGRKWPEWSEETRAAFIEHHWNWDRRVFGYCSAIYGISVEDFDQECDKRAKLDITA